MPDSKIEPRTLTADEQSRLVQWLYQQRSAQDALRATGLTKVQLHHLGRIMHARLQVHAILNLPESLWSTTHTQEVLFSVVEHMLTTDIPSLRRRRVPPMPRHLSVADLLLGEEEAAENDEERRVVAAVLRFLQEYEDKLSATHLTPRQRLYLDKLRHYRQMLDFLVEEPPVAKWGPSGNEVEPAEPTMTQRELEDFALWAYDHGFHRGVKNMRPDLTDDQIFTPWMGHFFAEQLIADWRADRRAEGAA